MRLISRIIALDLHSGPLPKTWTVFYSEGGSTRRGASYLEGLAQLVFTWTSHHVLRWVGLLVESQKGLETKVGLRADLGSNPFIKQLSDFLALKDSYEGEEDEEHEDNFMQIWMRIVDVESSFHGVVYVRDEVVDFSVEELSDFLEISTYPEVVGTGLKDDIYLHMVTTELTGGAKTMWPGEGKLSYGRLTLKYFDLYKISCINWMPSDVM
ncbi:hypothetical protein M9H77_23030 [Catharanthus roseus]|uniref:Uncharacterized protein n=1 Tax=Catharanthus roseus TaxID=4058 RepID=A0ACC0AUP7_CATRO|nr:hypothetical protein M9H77_23030 [Catharanthus roseus]